MLTLETVEVHTAGEPFRIVISGLPEAQGDSIAERRTWFRQYADDIRQALIFEPRGHADMYGGYLTQAVSPALTLG
ncbi:proline racemase family protein [Rouxiella badensis]|nr:proline racemase family protein [Rouxiella badensis]